MQSQDAQSVLVLKVWPWLEANLKRIILITGIFALILFVYSFFSYRKQQNEVTASRALTQAMMTPDISQAAAAVSQVASEYPHTQAGQRAALQSAAIQFANGKFPEAQSQFQTYLDSHPSSSLAATAALGVASSLDAQGKTDLATAAYQRVISLFGDTIEASSAKFALGGINEKQGKTTEAERFFEDVARSNPNSSLGNEAGMRAMELKSKLVATSKS